MIRFSLVVHNLITLIPIPLSFIKFSITLTYMKHSQVYFPWNKKPCRCHLSSNLRIQTKWIWKLSHQIPSGSFVVCENDSNKQQCDNEFTVKKTIIKTTAVITTSQQKLRKHFYVLGSPCRVVTFFGCRFFFFSTTKKP